MQRSNAFGWIFTIAAAVTAVSVVVSAGFSIAGLISPDFVVADASATSPAARVFALYAAARSLPLAIATLIVIYRRSPSGLLVLGGLVAAVQGSDAIVGLLCHDLSKTIGPFVLAVTQTACIFNLSRAARNRAAPQL